MEFVDLDVFFPLIQPNLDRCPEPVMYQHARAAAIELCEHAPIWRYENPLITLGEGVSDYQLDMPHEGARVHSVLGAWLGSRSLNPMNNHDLADRSGNAPSRQRMGIFEYSVSDRGRVLLSGAPTAQPNQLQFSVSLKPSREAMEVPQLFVDDYFDAIVEGTLGRAMDMVNRDWSNPAGANKHNGRFFRAKIQARMATDRGLVHSSQKLKSRRFVARSGNC